MGMLKDKVIKRNLLDLLKKHLESPEISLIVGPRQAGKTTLMRMLEKYLIGSGEKTIFLNLDFEEDNKYFSSQNTLIKKIELEFGKDKGYVFIDEIQRKQDSGVFLKGIYDRDLPYKFIVSGSGSIELKEKIHESLTGRKRLFELYPITFAEFADFRTNYIYSTRMQEFFSAEQEKTNDILDDYLNYGGYPRIVLGETLTQKLDVINEIYRSYIEKDIAFLLKVEKVDAFGELIKLLAGQVGQLVNYSEISNTLGISLPTVKNYLWYAEKTFVVEKVSPYFKNIRKEITKSPTYYFYDLGMRNFAAGCFGKVADARDKGFLFQNFILHILKEKLYSKNASIHFWRTTDRAEVDFVIKRGRDISPVEVKYRDYASPEIERSLRNFIDKYDPLHAFVITKGFSGHMNIGKTMVRFLPFWELLFLDSII